MWLHFAGKSVSRRSKDAPGRPQMAPRRPRYGSQPPPRGSKMFPRRPRSPQAASETGPGQAASRRPRFWCLCAWNVAVFGTCLINFWMIFKTNLATCTQNTSDVQTYVYKILVGFGGQMEPSQPFFRIRMVFDPARLVITTLVSCKSLASKLLTRACATGVGRIGGSSVFRPPTLPARLCISGHARTPTEPLIVTFIACFDVLLFVMIC